MFPANTSPPTMVIKQIWFFDADNSTGTLYNLHYIQFLFTVQLCPKINAVILRLETLKSHLKNAHDLKKLKQRPKETAKGICMCQAKIYKANN